MTDRELEREMLAAGAAMVLERGIATGLEAIPLDEVIREAGVSRTSAYRRWPKREQFYGDLLLELASGTTLPTPDEAIVDAARAVLADYQRPPASEHDHRDLVVELLRVTLTKDYDLLITSPAWRTFHTLLTAHEAIADPVVREAVSAELAAADRRLAAARSRIYAQFTALLGYRLTPPLAGPDGFDLMSQAVGAFVTGLLARRSLGYRDTDVPRPLRAFGSTRLAPWTPAAYMGVSTLLSFVEPDPGVRWDESRADALALALETYRPVS